MKILWRSSTPLCNSGYGQITRGVCGWFKDRGNEVIFATKHYSPNGPEYNWKGSPILMGTNHAVINELITEEGIDWCIGLEDLWGFGKTQNGFRNWVSYCPIDTEFVGPEIVNILKGTPGARIVIALSKHGKRELNKHKIDAMYAPAGFDPEIFHPIKDTPYEGTGRELRDSMKWTDENFVVGSVGINYGTDRKGFVPLLRAFKEFHNRHDNARLYLHTELAKLDGMALYNIIGDLGLRKVVAAPDQKDCELGVITQKEIAQAYDMMDVFILPTHGEGFGLPAIEAQACGIPVIMTNNTTGPELVKGGWLIEVTEDDMHWSCAQTWHTEPRPSAILTELENAYEAWKKGKLKEIGKKAHKKMKEYEWKTVLKNNWEPIESKLLSMCD